MAAYINANIRSDINIRRYLISRLYLHFVGTVQSNVFCLVHIHQSFHTWMPLTGTLDAIFLKYDTNLVFVRMFKSIPSISDNFLSYLSLYFVNQYQQQVPFDCSCVFIGLIGTFEETEPGQNLFMTNTGMISVATVRNVNNITRKGSTRCVSNSVSLTVPTYFAQNIAISYLSECKSNKLSCYSDTQILLFVL